MSIRAIRRAIVASAALALLLALALGAAPAAAAQGFGYGDPRSRPLSGPADVETTGSGFLLLESGRSGLLSRVDLGDGSFTPLAGGGSNRLSPEPQPADSVKLIYPGAIAPLGDDVVVTEPGWSRIARVSGGSIRTIFEDPHVSLISLAAMPGGDFLIGDYDGAQILRATGDGTTTRAAGNDQFGLSPDGSQQPGSSILYVRGIASTGDGGYVFGEYAADYSAVRRVAPDGTMTTLAGGHGIGDSGDGGPATAAGLAAIADVAVTADGNVLVATDNRIREIVPGGEIRTVAGTGERLYDDDGIPATEANIANPQALSPTPDGGFLLVADGRVRAVGPGGVIHTVAGMPAPGNCTEPRYNGIQGGSGVDELRGRRLTDLIRGELENDRLTGGAGRDCLLSGLGDDVVAGGNGGDRILSDNGADRLDGNDGKDVLVAEGGKDDLLGGNGADHLDGGFDDDSLKGEDGRDHLFGDTGRDVLVGGPGRDRIDAFTNERESYGGPADVIRCGSGRDSVKANSYDRVARSCEIVKGPAGA